MRNWFLEKPGQNLPPHDLQLLEGLLGWAEGPHYEFLGPGVDISLDRLNNMFHRTNGTVLGEVSVGPVTGDIAVGSSHRLFGVRGDVIPYQNTDVVVFDLPPEFRGGAEKYIPAFLYLLGRGAGNQPAISNPAYAAGGCMAPAPDPDGC